MTESRHIRTTALGVAVLAFMAISKAVAAPDEALLGADRGYPIGSSKDWWREEYAVGTHSNFDKLFPARRIPQAPSTSTLRKVAQKPRISYQSDSGEKTVEDYLKQTRTTALLILKDDQILLEHYQYQRTATDKFTSWSMAKSLLSLLMGVALSEGKISSLDDLILKYVPELANHPYGKTSLRQLLQMSSGIKYAENPPSGDGDGVKLVLGHASQTISGGPEAVAHLNTSLNPAGKEFNYSSADTYVAGMALQNALGKPLSVYMSEKIWSAIGAESEASWNTDKAGYDIAYAFFNATLRDWGRLGRLLANDGSLDGKAVIPRNYLIEATTPQGEHLGFNKRKSDFGYGYQFWLLPGSTRQFVLIGTRGQYLFVDPNSKLVMVRFSVRKKWFDLDDENETRSLWHGIVNRLSH